jgi:nitrite reductase (NADH) small subunit
MPQTIKIASKADLPGDGEAKEFQAGERMVCVANVEGKLCALDNVCLHRGGPLGQGVIVDGAVVCPWHGWMYNPQSGEAAQNPSVKVDVYPIRVEGDDVMIEI